MQVRFHCTLDCVLYEHWAGNGLTNIRMNALSFCYELWLIFVEMHYTCKCPYNYTAHYLPPIVLPLNIS